MDNDRLDEILQRLGALERRIEKQERGRGPEGPRAYPSERGRDDACQDRDDRHGPRGQWQHHDAPHGRSGRDDPRDGRYERHGRDDREQAPRREAAFDERRFVDRVVELVGRRVEEILTRYMDTQRGAHGGPPPPPPPPPRRAPDE